MTAGRASPLLARVRPSAGLATSRQRFVRWSQARVVASPGRELALSVGAIYSLSLKYELSQDFITSVLIRVYLGVILSYTKASMISAEVI